MFRDPGAEDMQRLFDMTQRGAFSGYTPELISSEVGDIPLVAAGVSEDQRFPVYLQGYIEGGISNDRFIAPPEGGTGTNISDTENKIPGWSFVDDSTNGAKAQWIWDGSAVQAYLDFYMTNGVAGDRVYIQQDVFVPGGNVQIQVPSGFFLQETAEDVTPFIEYAWVQANGTVGSFTEKTYTGVPTSGAVHRVWLMTKNSANAFLRLRFGYKVGTGYTATDEHLGSLKWTWIEEPSSYDVTLQFARTAWSPTNGGGPWALKIGDSNLTYGAACWTAAAPGLILAISIYTDDTITGGSLNFYAKNNKYGGGTSNLDGVCMASLTSGQQRGVDNRDLNGTIAYDFVRLDRLTIEADETGTFASAGNADYAGSLHLRLIVDNDGALGPAGG